LFGGPGALQFDTEVLQCLIPFQICLQSQVTKHLSRPGCPTVLSYWSCVTPEYY